MVFSERNQIAWSGQRPRAASTSVAKGTARTHQGKDIDRHQPQAERIAYFATEVRTAKYLADYARGEGAGEPHIDDMALVFAAEMVSKAAGQLDAIYLTGGSSALKPFQAALRRTFPGVPLVEGDLFGGVASGLAYAGAGK